MGKILLIPLKLNFTPNTLGRYGLTFFQTQRNSTQHYFRHVNVPQLIPVMNEESSKILRRNPQDAFAEPDQDTRNIAALQIAVVVEDVQDTPPEFVDVPPVTELRPDLQVVRISTLLCVSFITIILMSFVFQGDEVVRIRAEDGDKGKPRAIRYGLVAEGNPLTPFFTIDETSGK